MKNKEKLITVDKCISIYCIKKVEIMGNIYKIILLAISNPIDFKCFQYCLLAGPDGKFRPYSVASSLNQGNCLELYVRVLDFNEMAKKFFVQKNRVNIQGPFGFSILNDDLQQPIIFLAEGVGIVAFNAIINTNYFFRDGSFLMWLHRNDDYLYLTPNLTSLRINYNMHSIIFCDSTYEKIGDTCKSLTVKHEKIALYFAGSSFLEIAVRKRLENEIKSGKISIYSNMPKVVLTGSDPLK